MPKTKQEKKLASSRREEMCCPFVTGYCIKKTMGVCSLTTTRGEEVIICPKRLLADNFLVLREVARESFGTDKITFDRSKVGRKAPILIGSEIKTRNGRLDFVLIDTRNKKCANIELQTVDTTGGGKSWVGSYETYLNNDEAGDYPVALHGLNYKNVTKRLAIQLIEKTGLAHEQYFVIPDIVLEKSFSRLIDAPKQSKPGRNILSVRTYRLSDNQKIEPVRSFNVSIDDAQIAFSERCSAEDIDNYAKVVDKILEEVERN